VGETRVDLQHLLEDIRDAYPGSLEETIVTEIVANSLDSGAAVLRFDADSAASTLTVIDDGSGMARRDLARYHDIAASTKSRGQGIGFAGVGIKLGLLASEDVLTETKRGKKEVATLWHLASRHKAPWRWVLPRGLVRGRGTAVRLRLRGSLSPLLDPGFLEAVLRRQFQPLFDPAFDEILQAHYPLGVRVLLNGELLARRSEPTDRVPLGVRLGRKRKPSAIGYLARHTEPLPDDDQGLAISTLGKVIRRGWDWLGLTPSDPLRTSGLIEVPGLAESLTLNKADFIRTGSRGALYLAYRKGLQEAVGGPLLAWGTPPEPRDDQTLRRKTRPLERDLAAVLTDVADDFPLVAPLVAARAGTQKRLALDTGRAGADSGVGAAHVEAEGVGSGATIDPARGDGPPRGDEPASESSSPPPASDLESPAPHPVLPSESEGDVSWPTHRGRRKSSRPGLSIQFESRPDDPNLGRLAETTVWVNEAHPAYLRAAASRSEGYHLALTVALALAPLAAEPTEVLSFVTTFLSRWGEVTDRPKRRKRAPR
jgi:hypothetical protein